MDLLKFVLTTWILAFNCCMNVCAQTIHSEIRANGSFDIIGSSVKMLNCYPAINGTSLKPLSVKIIQQKGSKTIQYTLTEGILELSIGGERNTFSIKTSLKSGNIQAESISPIFGTEVVGAERFYRNPFSISGDAGIRNWPIGKSEQSSSLSGLIPESGSTLVISTRDYLKYLSFARLYNDNNGKKLMDVGIQTENVFSATLPTIYFTENQSVFGAMRNEASEIATAMKAKNDKPQSYHWCSWYYAYFYLTQNMLSEYIKGFKTMSPEVPVQTIQIDAGYHPHVGDWLEPSDKFPLGIAPSVKEITDNGYRAGIWIGPYMVGSRSKLYTEHPDWILCNTDGSPIVEMSFYGENRLWGTQDEEYYSLDTSNPAVMDYLRKVFRTFREMGITFFKTDFMVYGNRPSNTVKRFAPGKTSVEYQHEFFDMIRQEIGPESFWLGCIAPFAPMLGYVDGMRVSGDISADWEHGRNMFDESKGCQHLNNVWWQNDPDAIILRKKHNSMTDAEAKSLILWMGMLGGMVNTSDLFYEIPIERTDLFRMMIPGKTKITSTFPFQDKPGKLEVMVRQSPSGKAWAVLFVNRNDTEADNDYSLNSLIGQTKATCFAWETAGNQNLGEKQQLSVQLKPHESKLFYLATDGKSPEGITLGGM